MFGAFSKIDLMVRVLLVAILLAFLIPATGEARGTMTMISNAAIFLLFLLNGLRIDRREIARGAANLRFLVPLALWIFVGMAATGWGISLAIGWLTPSLVALGFLYLGVLPSTIQSATSYTMLAGGNVALSVIGAALINIAGVFISAPMFALLAGSEQANVGSEAIIRIGTILILPFVIGQIFQGLTRKWIEEQRNKIVWVDRLVIALAVYVAFSGAVEQGIWSEIGLADWLAISVGIIVMLAVGNYGAWGVSAILKLPREDRIAFLFAGSQKSAAIGVPLGAILFPPEVAGIILVPLLVYHLFQLVLAAPVSTRLSDPQN